MSDQWNDIKKQGSSHYKGGEVEPIDLYKSGGMLWDYCITGIIKYAYRNRSQIIDTPGPVAKDLAWQVRKDMDKIIHCAEMLKAIVEEGEECSKSNK